MDSDFHILGIFFLVIPYFMTGVELVTYSSTPWHDFLSLDADPKDYEKGLSPCGSSALKIGWND